MTDGVCVSIYGTECTYKCGNLGHIFDDMVSIAYREGYFPITRRLNYVDIHLLHEFFDNTVTNLCNIDELNRMVIEYNRGFRAVGSVESIKSYALYLYQSKFSKFMECVYGRSNYSRRNGKIGN